VIGAVASPFLVYVAGASRESSRAARVIGLLEESGVDVSFDWVAHMAAEVGELTLERARVAADLDLDGVRRASLVLLLEPSFAVTHSAAGYTRERLISSGVWAELGAALALRIPVLVARPSGVGKVDGKATAHDACVFAALASALFVDDDTAIRAVVRYALRGVLPLDVEHVCGGSCAAGAGGGCLSCVERALAGVP